MQNASAKKNIRVKLYDFDGCLCRNKEIDESDFEHKNINGDTIGIAGKKNWVIAKNKTFFDAQVKELESLKETDDKVDELIVASGTNRQDFDLDQNNSIQKRSPSCFSAYEDIEEFFKSQNLNQAVRLETFLSYDIGLAQEQHGQHFKDAIKFHRNFNLLKDYSSIRKDQDRIKYIEETLNLYNLLTENDNEKKQELKQTLQLIALWNKFYNFEFPSTTYFDNSDPKVRENKIKLIMTWNEINNLPVHYLDNSNTGNTTPIESQAQHRAAFDYSKITLLYAQAHKAASENPNALITIDFYDDNMNLLKNLLAFYSLYKTLLPANVRINLYKYDANRINEPPSKPDFSITGEGQIDSGYNNTLHEVFQKHAFGDLKEINYTTLTQDINGATREPISQYQNPNQLIAAKVKFDDLKIPKEKEVEVKPDNSKISKQASISEKLSTILRSQIKPSNILKSALVVFGTAFLIGVITVASGGIAPLSVFGLTVTGLGLAALKPLAVALMWTIANAFVCGLVGGAMTALVGSVMMGIQKIMGYTAPTSTNADSNTKDNLLKGSKEDRFNKLTDHEFEYDKNPFTLLLQTPNVGSTHKSKSGTPSSNDGIQKTKGTTTGSPGSANPNGFHNKNELGKKWQKTDVKTTDYSPNKQT